MNATIRKEISKQARVRKQTNKKIEGPWCCSLPPYFLSLTVALKSITTSFPSADALRRIPSTSPRVLGSRTAPPRRDMTGEDGANGGARLKAGVSIWHLPGIFGGDDGAADATARRAAASRPVVLANPMVCLVLRFVTRTFRSRLCVCGALSNFDADRDTT